MKTSILLDHEPAPGGRLVRALLRIEAEAAPPGDRLPLNLSLVLDRSGSMHGGKLEAARAAAALLVRRLSPDDVVSVVAYDDQVQTVALPAQGAAQATLPRQIESIHTGGSTNLSGGWLRAHELVAENLLTRGVNRIILLTDGLANVGLTDPQQLTGLAAQGKQTGVGTTTIGFGTDYDEALLRAMADAGGGNMYYIENRDQAAAIFADELQGLLDLGAQNVAVLVEPGPAARVVAVHHDYPSAQRGDGLRLELGDIHAREPKPLLVELLLGDDAAGDVLAVTFTISGDVLTADGAVERRTITLPVTVAASEGARIEPEVRRELLLLAAARARREALHLRERGEHDAAADTLRKAGSLLRSDTAFGHDAELQEEASDLSAAVLSFDAHTVSAADEKYHYQRAYSSMSGRRKKAELIRRLKHDEEPPASQGGD
jgi:Ca-activated chloride channel homolog